MSIETHTIPMHPNDVRGLQASTRHDDAVVIGDREYTVLLHDDGHASMYPRSAIIARYGHENDAQRWHAKVGDVLDLTDGGPFQIVLERIPGGGIRDVQPALVQIDHDDEDDTPLAGVPPFPLAISDDAIEKSGIRGLAACGVCKRVWLDDLSTAVTPVPSGRCPFETFHEPTPHPDLQRDETMLRRLLGMDDDDRYVVDVDVLAEVTADPVYATTMQMVDGKWEPVVHPIVLPAGTTITVDLDRDDDQIGMEPDGDDSPYSQADRRAWLDDRWEYVTVNVEVQYPDGRVGTASLSGVEVGAYWPGTTGYQIWHAIPDLVREAVRDIGEMPEPAPTSIDESASDPDGWTTVANLGVGEYRLVPVTRPVLNDDDPDGEYDVETVGWAVLRRNDQEEGL